MGSPLEIPELVEMIAQNLCKRDLFSAALTCRDFSEPAVRLLWFAVGPEKPSLYDFVNLLPKDKNPHIRGDPSILETLTLEDVKAMRQHASYVRVVTLDYADDIFSASSFPSRLAGALGTHVIFPSLRRLTNLWTRITPTDIRVFLAPSLTTLSVAIWDDISALDGYVCATPSLTRLKLDVRGNGSQNHVVRSALRKWTAITTLRIRVPWDAETLSCVASMPSLRKLTVSCNHGWGSGLDPGPLALDPGTNRHDNGQLRKLALLDISQCYVPITFMAIVRPTAVTSLAISRVNGAAMIRELCNQVCSLCDARLLTALTLASDESVPDMASWDNVKSLLKFHNLESVSLWINVVINDAAIDDMAKAWPFLRELRLPRASRSGLVSLRSLTSIVQHCTRLEHLRITLNNTESVARPPQWPAGRLCSPLRYLNIGRSRGQVGPVHIAAVLASFFPRLIAIHHGYLRDEHEQYDLWQDVVRMTPVIADAIRVGFYGDVPTEDVWTV